MKKDIEWLKEKIKKKDAILEKGYIHTNYLIYLIDKLDEPEVTYEKVLEWIENNEFYCHATAETVLENAVDKGELGYYGTKYSVVEKPVIPKYVAEHLDFAKSDVPLMRSKNNVISLWRHKETGEKHLQYESFSDLNHQDVLEKWEVQLDGYNRLEDGFNTVYSQHVVHQINITLNEMGVYKNHEIELRGDPVKGILTRKEVYEFIDKAMGV